MPVPLLYIYINRLASTPSVELVNNGEMWERLQVCLIFLIKLSFLSIRGTNVSVIHKIQRDVQMWEWCTNASVTLKHERDIQKWALLYTFLLSILLCLQFKIHSSSVKLNWDGQCILIWINLWQHYINLKITKTFTLTLSSGNLIENGNIVLYYLICNASKKAQKTWNTTKFISKRVSGGFIF